MSIKALLLYGSHARQESESTSDIDLLAVTTIPMERKKTVRQNAVSISFCHQTEIIRHARGGDLFVLHIVSEAKVLFDWTRVFPAIQAAFRYKDDYYREIRLASDLGWFLVRHAGKFGDPVWFNRRASWCARTILIAKAANHRIPIFSTRRLTEFAGSSDVRSILESKSKQAIESQAIESLERLLLNFGTPKPSFAPTLEEQRRIFEGDRNRLGLIALRRLSG